jgi:hypothetical protein
VPQRTAGTLGSAETAPHLPKEAAPAGVLVLRVMATRDYDWLLLCASPMRPGPRPSPERDRPVPRPLRSLRLRHPTKWPLRRRPHDTPSPSVRCASLSTCAAPLARTPAARPMRRPPLHPPLPAARSTLGGRSSPEPAKPTVRPSPCQGSGTVSLRSALPRKGRDNELSPVSRETLTPHPLPSGTPSVYDTITTMSSRMSWGALRAPAR